jgi:acyl-CoA synthetase (AMP-forming)/AMP-acid ligase II
MTISGGENLYPAEVEAVIQTHPTVRKGFCREIGIADLLSVIRKPHGDF